MLPMLRKPLTYFSLCAVSLLAAAIFYLLFWKVEDGRRMDREINDRLDKEIAKASSEAEAILASPERIWSSGNYPFYIRTGNRLTAWSSNFYEPEPTWFEDSRKERFARSLRGDFVIKSWQMPAGKTLLLVIPLIERFRITNRYLSTHYNPNIFPKLKTITIVPARNSDWFTLEFNRSEFSPPSFILWSFVIAFVAFIAGVYRLIRSLHNKGRYAVAFWSLLALLVTLRVSMIFSAFPAAWIPLPSFDSSAFASSAFNPTIFDLLLNSLIVLIFCGYLLVVYRHFRFFRKWQQQDQTKRSLLAALCITIAFFGFLFPFLFFESIFHDSSITLDWTQSLFFDGPRIVAFLSIVAGSVASFMFCHVWLNFAFRLTGNEKPLRFLFSVAAGGLLFGLYYIPAGRDYRITLMVGAVYFFILYLTRWTKGLRRTSYLTFLYLIFAVLCFGVQASLCNERFTNERTSGFQYRFGLNFLVERDVLGEYLLNEGASRIAQDPFIQSGLSNPFVSKGSLRQKIRQLHLSSYFNRYDVQVHLYTPAGDPVDNLSRSDLSGFVKQYKTGVGQTIYRGIYFINRADASTAKRYVAIVPAARQGRIMGYIALELSLKKIVPESVYPELLVDNRFAENFKAADYSYAIFQNDTLVSTFGTYNYETAFSKQWLETIPEGPEGKVIAGYRHILIAGEPGYSALITARVYPQFYLASNVAFWSLFGIVIITIVILVGIVINLRRVLVLNYATRIQLYVFLAFIIPLVAVSITTLYWTSLSAEEDLKAEFTDKTRKIADQIAPNLGLFLSGLTDATPLQEELIATARLSGVDATIYSPSGHLVATNQVQIFDNLILSNLINPGVLRKVKEKESAFILEETIGKLTYNNSYRLLRSESTGDVLGILSIPFFNSGDSLDRSRVIILSNIQIVFMIIFILFTVLSFIVTRWFTFPLRMITRSLSNTTLKQENKPLNWQSNDEIGWMVQEYNRMLSNLEKNKIELARSQKESAWREMAQQVAHEIKNPLTPMKLTLQQLEMLMHAGSFPKEKAESAVKNLLVQLEILNEIATSFSSFARMPAPILHRTDASRLVEKAVALYTNHPAGTVTLKPSPAGLFVMGDDQLLSRIFSNLILNGLQSGRDSEKMTVEVAIALVNGQVVASFHDNGIGIEEILRDKVFMPHFTTKKSGSGLGLAISRQGIEQSGGSIWFETSADGTTFFISLPAA
ncbi:MAG TPA: HAMP domain-containing sensor histidine kinase [Cyclobacteriaceae bacterium]|nr:HAMP domain-containing sensor histidine kinase [Cyclobacteriaceae bacterium]